MRKVEIEGEAKIKFYQTIEVTDEEFEILDKDDYGNEVDQILDRKLDPGCISEITDFYIFNKEEQLDD